MLTANVNLEDRLVNMLVGVVMDVKVVNNKVKQDLQNLKMKLQGELQCMIID